MHGLVNVKMMRRIDGLVGNLVCSALAVAKQVATPFARPRGPIKKIAIMKFFGMGSIVVASPCLAALRDLYPGAELHFVTFKSNRELLLDPDAVGQRGLGQRVQRGGHRGHGADSTAGCRPCSRRRAGCRRRWRRPRAGSRRSRSAG